jgi:hypothetical protein
MVRAERFELPTFWFVARRSIQLSYARRRYKQTTKWGQKLQVEGPPGASSGIQETVWHALIGLDRFPFRW